MNFGNNNNYYYLVTGLPDLAFDIKKLTINLAEYIDELKNNLSSSDIELFQYFLLENDVKNLFNILHQNKTNYLPNGEFSKTELENEINNNETIPDTEIPKNALDLIKNLVIHYKNEILIYNHLNWENQFTLYYYDFILNNCKSQFVKDWIEFDLNIKNLTAAINCHKFGCHIDHEVLGGTHFALQLKSSKAKDFGLSAEFDYVDKILSFFESSDLLFREQQIDLLRWKKLDEMTVFSYFNVEIIIAYYLKLKIVERWLKLDINTGKEMFTKLYKDLVTNYEFPKEFSLDESRK